MQQEWTFPIPDGVYNITMDTAYQRDYAFYLTDVIRAFSFSPPVHREVGDEIEWLERLFGLE
jgi:hypothetical protein